MTLKSLALGVALVLAVAAPAEAQRRGGGGGGAGNWELLGEEKVGIGADRDIIRLNRDENFYRNKSYRRLRFVAEGGEVRMRSVRLHFLNGHVEDVSFEQNLRPGQEVDVDLRGERSYLRQIEMFYKGKFGISIGGGALRVNQASIKVLGENVFGGGGRDDDRRDRDRKPDFRPDPSWQLLGTQAVGRDAERDVVRIEKPADFYRDRGFDQLHFVAEKGDVHLMQIRVVYQNGFGETVRIDRLIRDGGQTAVDLPGRRSYLREVEMTYRKLPGTRGRAVVSIYGEQAQRRRR